MAQRPIKFRAWDKERGQMVVPDIIYHNTNLGLICDKVFTKNGHTHSVDPSEIIFLQFTGLTDKNGKEIYEGDIVQEDEELTTDVIEWDGAGWATRNWFESRELMQEAPLLEVIGNIYENPELLQKQPSV